jgi:hypothetical protein
MSDAIGMPYWFWGIVCAAFSALVLLGGLWRYVRPARVRRTPGLAGRDTLTSI